MKDNFLLSIQSKSFNSVGRNISALVGCIKKLRTLYEVQLLEIYKIPQLNLIYLTGPRKKLQRPKIKKS